MKTANKGAKGGSYALVAVSTVIFVSPAFWMARKIAARFLPHSGGAEGGDWNVLAATSLMALALTAGYWFVARNIWLRSQSR